MKATASDYIEIFKLVGLGVGAWWLWKYGRKLLSPLGDELAPVGEAIGSGLSDVTSWLNGYTPVETNDAGFVLSSKYIGADSKVNYDWMQAIIKANAGNQALFNTILDPLYRVKPEYQTFIDKEVSAVTLENGATLTDGSVF